MGRSLAQSPIAGPESHIVDGFRNSVACVRTATYARPIMRSIFVLIECRGEAQQA